MLPLENLISTVTISKIDFFDYDVDDEKLDNVTFIHLDKKYKICKYIFYRIGGICRVPKLKTIGKKKEEYYSAENVTDETFYDMTKYHVLNFFDLIEKT